MSLRRDRGGWLATTSHTRFWTDRLWHAVRYLYRARRIEGER